MVLPSNYIVERKPVKHIRVRVSVDRSVRIIVPLDFSEDELDALIHKKQEWIDVKLNKLSLKGEKIAIAPNQIFLHGERYTYIYWEKLGHRVNVNHQHRTVQSGKNLLDPTIQAAWCRIWARKTLLQQVQKLSEENKFTYNRVYIRNQMTKWGNCSAKKNISLNWRLVRAPQNVVDYVILHELLHTEIMNHSQQFWIRMRSIVSDYQTALAWLEKYGSAIF
jgi:predicted metal-dependent hydrolase